MPSQRPESIEASKEQPHDTRIAEGVVIGAFAILCFWTFVDPSILTGFSGRLEDDFPSHLPSNYSMPFIPQIWFRQDQLVTLSLFGISAIAFVPILFRRLFLENPKRSSIPRLFSHCLGGYFLLTGAIMLAASFAFWIHAHSLVLYYLREYHLENDKFGPGIVLKRVPTIQSLIWQGTYLHIPVVQLAIASLMLQRSAWPALLIVGAFLSLVFEFVVNLSMFED